MNVQCASCSARYAVPDEKVQGRKVRIKCKKCQGPILIDGTSLGPAQVASSPPAARPSSRAPQARPSSAPQSTGKRGYKKTVVGMPSALSGPSSSRLPSSRPPVASGGVGAGRTATSRPPAARRVSERPPAQRDQARAPQRTLLGGLGTVARQGAGASRASQRPRQKTMVGGVAVSERPPEPIWTVAVSEQDQRELPTRKVVELYAAGIIDEGTFVWKDGMADWLAPFEIDELARAMRARGLVPREPQDSDAGFDDSDETVVGTAEFPMNEGDRQSGGVWREPGRAVHSEPNFEDVTVSMDENETAGLLRKARQGLEDDTVSGRARPYAPPPPASWAVGGSPPPSSRPTFRPGSPFAEAARHAPVPQDLPPPDEFDDEEVTRALDMTYAPDSGQLPGRVRGYTPPVPEVGTHGPGLADLESEARERAARVQAAEQGVDMFANVHQAGAGHELGPASSSPPTRPGARNESSVLFSLDALTKKAPPSTPPPRKAKLDLLAPDDRAPPSLSRLGTGTPLGAPDVTAPWAEPPPPPEPISFDEEPDSDLVSDAQPLVAPAKKKSRVGRWLLLVLLLALVGGGAYGYATKQPLELWARVHALSKGRFPKWPELAPPAEDNSAGDAAKPNAPDEKRAPPVADEDTTATPSKDEKTDEAGPGKDEHETKAKKADEKDEKAERKARDEEAEPEPERPEKKDSEQAGKEKTADEPQSDSELPPFDRAAAAQALGTIAGSVGSCKREEGPTGTGRATVTFASSGRATSANVSGSFAGTTVGGCVARLFRKARVPAFSGGAVTVAKRFTIE